MADGSSGTVLVVDDDEAIRESLTRTLSRMGLSTFRATTAEEGLELVRRESPDVVFLDIRLGEASGVEFLRTLRGEAASARPSVVAMSGSANLDEIIEVIRLGAVDYIRKPWNLTEVISAVTTALDASRSTQHARDEDSSDETTVVAPITPGIAEELDQLRRDLESGRLALPLPDEGLRPLTELLSTTQAQPSDVARELERNAELSPYVLRAANLRSLTTSGRIVALGSAIAHLGQARLRGVVQAWSLKRFCDTPSPTIRQLLMVIWQRSVARATAMRALAKATARGRLLDPDEAFLVGLMADIGALALLWAASERERDGDASPVDPMALLTFVRREHETLSEVLLRSRHLPPSVAATAATHHGAVQDQGATDWLYLFKLGERVTHDLIPDRDPTGVERLDLASVDQSARALGLERWVIQDVIRDVLPEFEALRGEQTWLGA